MPIDWTFIDNLGIKRSRAKEITDLADEERKSHRKRSETYSRVEGDIGLTVMEKLLFIGWLEYAHGHIDGQEQVVEGVIFAVPKGGIVN